MFYWVILISKRQNTSIVFFTCSRPCFVIAVTGALRPVIGWAIIETGEQPDAPVTARYRKKPLF